LKISSERAFLAVAVAMTLGLVLAAAHPSGSAIVADWLHDSAHIGAFAAVSFAWALALPKVPAPLVMLAVAAFGLAHEGIEISGHAHPFEIGDVWLDAAGAVAGVVFARLLRQKTATPPLR
jgi:hypothetical protein